LLHNYWSELPTTDGAAGNILKSNLVTALYEKMQWMDITALHVAVSYLDPSLLRMVKNGEIYLSRQYKLHERMQCILMAFL